MRECKQCANFKDFFDFPQIKRKDKISYRMTCKACEKEKALARRRAKSSINATGEQTDPALLRDDVWAKMPSDSDLLYWSTDYYDIATEGRSTLINKVPEDK